MVEGSAALWFNASGFELLGVVDDGVELVVEVQSTATVVGCSECGVRAKPKDRRWVKLRDTTGPRTLGLNREHRGSPLVANRPGRSSTGSDSSRLVQATAR